MSEENSQTATATSSETQSQEQNQSTTQNESSQTTGEQRNSLSDDINNNIDAQKENNNNIEKKSFNIPEKYKDAGWAKEIDSIDRAFEKIENLEKLKGKRTYIPDWENATPDQIDEFVKAARPKEKNAYKFDENINDQEKELYSDILYEAGVTEYQGNKVIEKYLQKTNDIKKQAFSKEGFESILKESFGEDYTKSASIASQNIKAHLNENDRKILDTIPNQHLGLIYRLAKNISDKYGVTESDRAATEAGVMGSANVLEVRKELHKKINELTKRQHTNAEKQALVDRLRATYK